MNKKAASFSGWAEIAIFSLAFVSIFAIIVTGLNLMYDKDYNTGFVDNDTSDALIDYQGTLTEQITGGETEFTSDEGITLKNSWTIIKSFFSLIGNFLSGSWIERVVTSALPSDAGVVLAWFLRILWFISLGLIIMKLLFKIKP